MAGAISELLHEPLNKLRIIAKIKPGQKLNTINQFDIYTDSLYNRLVRMLSRENRFENTRYLQNFYKNVFDLSDNLIKEYKNINDTNKKKYMLQTIINVASELKESVTGLNNLLETYQTSEKTVAEIDGIIKDYFIITYNALLESLQPAELSDALKKPVIFNNKVIITGTEIDDIKMRSDVTVSDNFNDQLQNGELSNNLHDHCELLNDQRKNDILINNNN